MKISSIPFSAVHNTFTKILTAGYSVLPFVDEKLCCFHRYHILIQIRLFAQRIGWKCTSLTSSYLVSTIELPNFSYFLKILAILQFVTYVRLKLSNNRHFQTAIFNELDFFIVSV